ncbi:transketolase, partial [bacterium]
SKTPGHPENILTEGVEMATGPLGQGLAHTVGMAIAERFLAARYNRPGHEVVDHHTYAIVSDGDLMEGLSSEAGSLAGHLGLGKLIWLYDSNSISIDGSTEGSFTEDVAKRFEAFDWHVLHVADGMSVDAVDAAITEAKAETSRPTLIVCRTTICFGSPTKAGSSKSHGSPLGPEDVRGTKLALGLDPDQDFAISDEVSAQYASLAAKGADAHRASDERMSAYHAAFPTEATELERVLNGEWSMDWLEGLTELSGSAATRKHGETVLQAMAAANPTVLGGSADLFESTFTHVKGSGPFTKDDPTGRNVYYGVREHAMAAAANGGRIHGGVVPIASTFLMFADYCRPSIRLACLMECPSVYVFTHDSIGVGEDGPTHQPIEHLAALRAIPHLNVFRPCDGHETAVAYAVALGSPNSPTLLALSRQAVPSLSPTPSKDHPAFRGGYILAGEGTPDVVLIGTGSEVQHCVAAREALKTEGIEARVVSLPSWHLFELQDPAYRAEVLPKDVPTLSVEAATSFGWAKYADAHVAIDDFGISAPAGEVMAHFGFTAENVAVKARELLGK